MTAYVEPRQEEEEPWSSARGGEQHADARGGEQRADALGGEQRANAVEGSTAPSPFGVDSTAIESCDRRGGEPQSWRVCGRRLGLVSNVRVTVVKTDEAISDELKQYNHAFSFYFFKLFD
ncbi:hypothetical protein HN51_044411 [Arachis hypogaea]